MSLGRGSCHRCRCPANVDRNLEVRGDEQENSTCDEPNTHVVFLRQPAEGPVPIVLCHVCVAGSTRVPEGAIASQSSWVKSIAGCSHRMCNLRTSAGSRYRSTCAINRIPQQQRVAGSTSVSAAAIRSPRITSSQSNRATRRSQPPIRGSSGEAGVVERAALLHATYSDAANCARRVSSA